MKIIVIVSLSVIAASLTLPVLPLVLPVLVGAFIVLVPFVFVAALGAGVLAIAACLAKLTFGIVSAVAAILLPVVLLIGAGAAVWSIFL